MPSIPLVTELGARAGEFQHILNMSKIPAQVEQKLRPAMDPGELFTYQDSRIFVRARPIVAHDMEDPNNQSIVQKVDENRDLVVMTPKISLSGECTIDPCVVTLDGVFVGARDDTERVYLESCAPLVSLSVNGASTCVLCYGQTGSGKTYTTSGIFRLVALDLAPAFATHDILLTVLEIQALKNIDLLTGTDVQVVEDVSGELKLLGTEAFECSSAEMLLAAFEEAASQRTTRSTERNETSSRSHMIARISIVSKETKWAKPGDLFIVDLAGSENTADSATHDKTRQAETKFINTSLMTLKDCIRSRALASSSTQHLHIPYRRSPLTLLLRDCFEIAVRRPTKTVMIACVSPLLRDSRHTINTLRYASMLAVTPPSKVLAPDPNDPNNYTREQALDFLVKVSHGNITEPEYILPEGDGRTLVHIPEAEFIRRIVESHPHIPEKKAKLIYTAVWKRVVDARTKGRKQMVDAKRHIKAPRCAM
ncbi:Kinesin-13 6 [Leishmania donovani]|uniref:Kinesin-13_6_-_putative n=3 Tax=Leishmania donovani species complex TaxID=38574 RepID=A0A6L0XVY2_LEIIN|nr:putative MCAK-like kinesin [Leishmania infantum JPCM5]XP_003865054.1 MCAK-like kinesin, putative [Leishmania donovani]CAC9547121.1 Kinesin-13_6_-_putative [Leishmania infantum]AYU83277.1 Kinesin-13 6, putative [Leishmania donovani]TPP44144.1 Kinesin motor domain family protein [Leishmania donovani]TPP44727.1 Kinesin motor domain family protein [Leishmania donovani]TPP47866.1 Kinesin motor domain family protein [Leishmania donovani]|eukprot:XP_001469278.1 putative MCAK-like kinesin [Leishmania infantum JPCM5]